MGTATITDSSLSACPGYHPPPHAAERRGPPADVAGLACPALPYFQLPEGLEGGHDAGQLKPMAALDQLQLAVSLASSDMPVARRAPPALAEATTRCIRELTDRVDPNPGNRRVTPANRANGVIPGGIQQQRRHGPIRRAEPPRSTPSALRRPAPSPTRPIAALPWPAAQCLPGKGYADGDAQLRGRGSVGLRLWLGRRTWSGCHQGRAPGPKSGQRIL